MRKSVALLALFVLTMPYLRAPLCQAGSHEHPSGPEVMAEASHEGGAQGREGPAHDHGQAHDHGEAHDHGGASPRAHHLSDAVTPTAVGHGAVVSAPADADCHERMMCDAVADLGVSAGLGGDYIRVAGQWTATWRASGHPDVSLTLELPPPRPI